ncbi:WG repeat-containing protein [Flavobacterium urocaniciphilum]|uniref:WG containing repeat-containing protein n=1 Tax=Flavobacterium urocaniciphilum TaxID=1299341 RepID=A0A1H9DZG9_9FLAO|nr:WG repeat-containing protein [Flavobacterium urocaniciphilum]SEQ18881.1 WG containing repeat-containing protein [Flavobacterium urocaniciphilum]
MVFKVKLLPLFLLFNLLVMYSQEIAIPYRDGNKWGMCNPEGKIIIEPKYDKLEFKEYYDSDFQTVFPKLKNKTGLILNGKIIFEANYSQIYFDDENFVLISDENNNKTTEIISKEGNALLKKPIIEIISSEHITEKLKLYHVLNKDFTESVFLLDKKTKVIEQWLYEDYYSLYILKKVGGRFDLVFNTKKSQNDPLQTDVWNVEKAPFVKTKKLMYESEDKYLEQFYQKAKNKTNSNNSGYGSGTGNGELVTDSGYEEAIYSSVERGDSDVVVDMGEPEVNKKPQLYFTYILKKENEKLVLETKQENLKEAKKTITPLNLKEPVKNVEVLNYYFYKNTKDSILNYRNIAYFKTKNKTGVILPTNISKVIEFDTIVKVFNQVKMKDSFEEITFVAGNKNNKTNQFKYSLISNKKGLIFPLQFDEISNFKLQINNGNVVYKTRMGDKFGLIESNGNVLLKTEYEDFKHPGYNHHTNFVTKNYLLLKNNKFGLIYHNDTTYKDEIIEAIFDYQIDDVLVNFPYKGRYSTNHSKLTLVTLKNSDNEIIGYANVNGTLYFKN